MPELLSQVRDAWAVGGGVDGWMEHARGAVAKFASRTQRRYPAFVPGRIANEGVEAGFVARGEGAALQLLERWRVSQRLGWVYGAIMRFWEYVVFTELLVAATSDR